MGGLLTTVRVVCRIGELLHGALHTMKWVIRRLMQDERINKVHGLQTTLRKVLGHIPLSTVFSHM